MAHAEAAPGSRAAPLVDARINENSGIQEDIASNSRFFNV